VSFILDALRKSEHERQRSTLPGLAHVPVAPPPAQLPRWALVAIGALALAVVGLAAAWWQSARMGLAPVGNTAPVTRSVELPPPAQPAPTSAPSGVSAAEARSPAPAPAAPRPSAEPLSSAVRAPLEAATAPPAAAGTNAPVDSRPAQANEPELPSAAALAAEGVAVPPLRLELHAYSTRPGDRFVFINGRKYAEGERLPEGPVLVSIEPRGAVLSLAGRRFLLVQE
jgi:general secretion pathway protein B